MTTKRRSAVRKKPVDAAELATFAAASVMPYQTVNRYSTRAVPDVELVARAISGTYYAACNLLATVCVAQTLRLMRPVGAGEKLPARKVRSIKQLDWLKGEARHQPGRKAMIAASGADEIEEVLDHPALDTLYKPCPHMTYGQWYWLIRFWQEASGRAYAWYGDDPAPTSLYPLNPQYVNVVGSKTNLIELFRFGRDTTGGVDLPAEQVAYFRERIHPSDPLGGISWAHAAVMPSDMEAAALTAEIKRWENGGFPGGIIELDGTKITNAEQLRQYRTAFESAYRGVSKAGSWMLIANGKANQSNIKPHELAYKDGLTLAEERIFRAAGIPEAVWKMNDANRASAVAGDPVFMAYRVLPAINADAEKLTEDYLSRFPGTEGWWFCFDNPVAEDAAADRAMVNDLTDRGIITQNEGRAIMGMAPAGPELDLHRYMGTPMIVPQAPTEEATEDEVPDEPVEAVEDKPEDEAVPPEKPTEEVREPETVKASELTCECGGDHVCKADDALSRARADFEAAVRTWFEGAVRNAITPEGAMSIEPDAELRRIIDTGLREVFRAATSDAAMDLDASFNLSGDAAAAYANEHAATLVTNVTETLRTQVRESIVNGLEQGRTLNQVRDDLQASGIAENRTETIVRTETSDAANSANRIMYEQAGWQGKEWLTAGGPCPLCDAIGMAKGPGTKPTPIAEPYYRTGDAIMGTNGKVYVVDRDLMGPPSHPNCVLPSTQISAGGVWAAMRANYTGPIIEIRTNSGRGLSVTENHLIMTDRGWVPAHALREGDNAICTGVYVESGFSDPHNEDVPSTAEQVFNAARVASGVPADGVPSSAEHFHGDGVFLKGQVDVVSTSGLLRCDGDIAAAEFVFKNSLIVTHSKSLSLSSDSAHDALFLGARLAADGSVAGFRQAKSLLGGSRGHADVHRLAAIALAKPGLLKSISDGGSAHAELCGEFLDRTSAFGVHLEKVVHVKRLDYSGHVYDFSTVGGAYSGNGIISHNCRCSQGYVETLPKEGAE